VPACLRPRFTIGSLTDSEPGMTLIWEFLSTFFVVFVVYAVTFNKDFKPIGPFAIGVRHSSHFICAQHLTHVFQLAVTAATFASGPFTGSSFNPSRTLAAAFVFSSFHQVSLLLSRPVNSPSYHCSGLDLPPCYFGRWRCCRTHFRARFPQGAQLTFIALPAIWNYVFLVVCLRACHKKVNVSFVFETLTKLTICVLPGKYVTCCRAPCGSSTFLHQNTLSREADRSCFIASVIAKSLHRGAIQLRHANRQRMQDRRMCA
jgi:hypothetical protein